MPYMRKSNQQGCFRAALTVLDFWSEHTWAKRVKVMLKPQFLLTKYNEWLNSKLICIMCTFIVWMEYSITRSFRIWTIISYLNWPFFLHTLYNVNVKGKTCNVKYVMKNIFFLCNIKSFSLMGIFLMFKSFQL